MTTTPTEEQLAVINHRIPGHGRVLAGPGTGKSTVAVGLARRLLKEDPSIRLKFLTFTRAATFELEKKLEGGQKEEMDPPSTIHSFSISHLLRNPGCAPFPEPLRIPSEYEYEQLIRKHLARAMGVSVWRIDDLVREMAAKWESLSPIISSNVSEQERARFMGLWQRHRRIFGYTLVQELPDLFRCALRDHEDLEGVDYDLLIVDEYQDLNACDLEVIGRLAARGASILAIGDDDQSIYSFRKAHPNGIRRFLTEYKTENDYALTVCHRSASCIIEWAQYVIAGDVGREPKKPLGCRVNGPEGTAELLCFKGETSEARGVANLAKWLIEKNDVRPSEMVVLCRTDHYGRFTKPIQEEFGNLGIEVSNPNKVDKILLEGSNLQLIAFLRLLLNKSDSLAWWDFLAIEKGIGSSFVDSIWNHAEKLGVIFGDAFSVCASEGFVGFPVACGNRAMALLQSLKSRLSAINLPDEDEETRWGEWIIRGIKNGKLPDCSSELKGLLAQLDEENEPGEGLGRFLSQIGIRGRDLMIAESQGVRFMTMSSAKGMTFRAVIIVGVENDLIPRPQMDIQEERRLLYVAMTRAKEFLFLTWAGRRRGPTARSGKRNVAGRRQPCEFLRGGPVESRDGDSFIRDLPLA
jgi:DNA helicase-2/ATP-dependent DNA helicase PcrA